MSSRSATAAQTLLVGLTTAIRQPLLTARVRVRQWGRLPRRRGPTLLIANHQHEDESEIVVERAFVQGGFRPLFTASSRRMYEPGFFATRMPWLAPLMRTVNAGPLFVALGMLPLENELSSRPLRSIAAETCARHGDVPLSELLRGDALAAVPAGARTARDLLSARFFDGAEARVRIAHVCEPYRRDILAAIRASLDADIAHIAGVVCGGATFFVTPEGFYSTDGRMRPLKGIVEHLLPIADVWLAAIAFDPFRGRRLSLLYRIAAFTGANDLALELAAARPVTTSALLGSWLADRREPFTVAEAVEAVVRGAAALPARAFRDPELADPASCALEALAGMMRRGIVAREGGRCRLGARRIDRRFPGVEDIVSYQARFHRETLDALARLKS